MLVKSESVFRVSLNVPLAMLLTFSLILFLIGVSSMTRTYGVFAGSPALVFALFPLYGFIRYQRIRVRSSSFYSDHLVLVGKGLRKKIGYDEIVKVVKVKPHSFWTPLTQIHLYLREEAEPFIVFSNPHSRKLNVDLYSWLEMKIAGRRT